MDDFVRESRVSPSCTRPSENNKSRLTTPPPRFVPFALFSFLLSLLLHSIRFRASINRCPPTLIVDRDSRFVEKKKKTKRWTTKRNVEESLEESSEISDGIAASGLTRAGLARFSERNMERKNIGTLTGNDALPCVSARRITLPFPFTVIFTTRRVTLCMIVERSRRASIILFQPTLRIPLSLPTYNIQYLPPHRPVFPRTVRIFRTGFDQPPPAKSCLDPELELELETSRFSLFFFSTPSFFPISILYFFSPSLFPSTYFIFSEGKRENAR